MEKFKQTFSIIDGENNFTAELVKIVRPSFNIPEKQKEDGSWELSGPCIWEPIITAINSKHLEEKSVFWEMMRKDYDFTSQENKNNTLVLFNGRLDLYNNDDIKLESWEIMDLFPTSINFGESYSSDNSYDIEVSWKYSGCKYIPTVPTCPAVNYCFGDNNG